MVNIVVKSEDQAEKPFSFSEEQRVTIGRRPDSDICLQHPAISAEHAFVYTNFATFIQDNGSTNGTFVKGRRISRTVLMEGDDVVIGPYTLSVSFRGTPSTEPPDDVPLVEKTMIFSNMPHKEPEPGIVLMNGTQVGKLIGLSDPFVTLGEPGKHAALVMRKPSGFSISQITSSSQDPGEIPRLNGTPLDESGKMLSDQDVITVSGLTHKFLIDINSLRTGVVAGP